MTDDRMYVLEVNRLVMGCSTDDLPDGDGSWQL